MPGLTIRLGISALSCASLRASFNHDFLYCRHDGERGAVVSLGRWKTGTARKLSNGGYSENKYVASFVGFAPASNPRVIVAVMVDEPKGLYYGGQVAAPVFANIVSSAMRMLNVQPDAPNRPVVVVPAVAESPL